MKITINNNLDIKSTLGIDARIYYLNILMAEKKLTMAKAYVFLNLMLIAEKQTKLLLLDNFETLYMRIFIYAKYN